MANEITKLVKNSNKPCEEIKYLARVLDVLWEQSRAEEGIAFKKTVSKITIPIPSNFNKK